VSILLSIVRGRLTSAGFEREARAGGAVVNHWYGVVYPGNGSVIVGGETTFQPDRGQPVDSFDLASAWLEPFPMDDLSQKTTWWGRVGFVWHFTEHKSWVGVPAWLVAVMCGVLPVWSIVRAVKRRKANVKSGEGRQARAGA
jgi:hypothetical protein